MTLDRTLLLKPVEKLAKRIKKVDREPDPSSVHDLRTNVRRFEAIFKALSLERYGIHRSMLKDLNRLDKHAGKVRDMDVLIRYGSTVHPKTGQAKHEEDSAVQLLEHLANRRAKQARKLRGDARRLRRPLGKDLKRASSVLAKLAGHTRDGKAPGDAMATEMKLKGQLAAFGRLGKNNLHAFRLKVKELRNVLQMDGAASRSKLTVTLGRVKDAIGEWHDWEMLVTLAQKALDRDDARGLIAELKRVSKNRYREALLLAGALQKTV